MTAKLLSDNEIEAKLGELKGWVYDSQARCLKKGFESVISYVVLA